MAVLPLYLIAVIGLGWWVSNIAVAISRRAAHVTAAVILTVVFFGCLLGANLDKDTSDLMPGDMFIVLFVLFGGPMCIAFGVGLLIASMRIRRHAEAGE